MNSYQRTLDTGGDAKPLLTSSDIEEKLRKDARKKWIIIGSVITLLLIIIIVVVVAVSSSDSSSSSKSKDWSQEYLLLTNATRIQIDSAYLSSESHVAGTDANLKFAYYVKQQFEQAGFTTTIENISDVVLSYPISSNVSLVDPSTYEIIYQCKLEEDVYSVDPITNNSARSQAWLAYTPNGSVTGDLVYVNYGLLEDFENLVKLNVPLAGKIGIARYGEMYRGNKVKNAAHYNMIGLIIYSDPADDGYSKGPVYPDGPWRPESSFQRGSTHFSEICPGNPQTDRLKEKCNATFSEVTPSIPAVPMSYGDAWHLLSHLSGLNVSEHNTTNSWQGGLNFTYHIGGDDLTYVTLNNENIIASKTLYNVIAQIEGEVYKNETILLGNHRDAWVFGGGDPISGTAPLLELVRSFGELYKQGWRPKRNIMFANWDGEEYGLMGSTHFTEGLYSSIVQNTVISYINVDIGVVGHNLLLEADPLIAHRLVELMQDVSLNGKSTLYDNYMNYYGKDGVSLLGSGSDYVAYVNLGIPSANLAFEGSYGVYHSLYDDNFWMNIIDYNRSYSNAMTQYWGLIALDFSGADIYSWNLTNCALSLNNTLVYVYNEAVKYNCTYIFPPYNWLGDIEESLQKFLKYSILVDNKINYIKNHKPTANQIKDINTLYLNITKGAFVSGGTNANRPYFKYLAYGPDPVNGYAYEVYPFLIDAIRNQCIGGVMFDMVVGTNDMIGNAVLYLETFYNKTI